MPQSVAIPSRRWFAGAIAAVFLVACSAEIPTTPSAAGAPSFSGGSGSGGGGTGGGGGGGGGGSCTPIRQFSITPGYYPGSKTWGAIWNSVSIKGCDSTRTIRGVLTGEQLTWSAAGSALLGQPIGQPNTIAYQMYSVLGKSGGGTIDWEPVSLGASFGVRLDVYDEFDVLIASKSITVSTPAP